MYAVINDLHEQGVPVAALCQTLDVSRSGYLRLEAGLPE